MKKMRKGSAFTLVEIIIVIAVIAILAAILVPTFSSVISKGNRSKALASARGVLTPFLTENFKAKAASQVVIFVENGNEYYIFGYNIHVGELVMAVDNPYGNYRTFNDLLESNLNGEDGVFVLTRDQSPEASETYRNLAYLIDDVPAGVHIYEGYLIGDTIESGFSPTFTVTYLPGDGVDASLVLNLPSVQTVPVNGKHSILGSYIAREDYQFVGWKDIDDPDIEYSVGQLVTISKPTTLVAQWRPDAYYTLSFDGDGGEVTLAPGTELTALSSQILVGTDIRQMITQTVANKGGNYTFRCWMDTETGTLYPPDFVGPIVMQKDYSLKAVYNDFKVTYVENAPEGCTVSGMPSPLEIESPAGEAVTISDLIPTCSNINYLFAHWVSSTGLNISPGGTIPAMPAENITLTAFWQPFSFNIEYASHDGTTNMPENTTVTDNTGSYTISNTVPSREGYRFNNWGITYGDIHFIDPGEAFDYTNSINGTTVTLQANWTPLYNLKYRRCVLGVNEVIPPIEQYAEGDTVTISAIRPSAYDGHNFTGWKCDTVSENVLIEGDTFLMPGSDIFLDSQWTEEKYHVTYHAEDGVTVPTDTNEYIMGDAVTISSTLPERTGYSFFGWNFNGTTFNPGDTLYMPASDVALTAQWVQLYSITYVDGVDGEDIAVHSAQSATAGAQYTVCNMYSVRENYVFTGWKASHNDAIYQGGDLIEMPAENITMTAQWNVGGYTLSYTTFGTTTPEELGVTNMPLNESHAAGEVFTLSNTILNTTQANKYFCYWFDAEAVSQYHPGDSFTMPNNSVRLQAIWCESFTVSYEDGVTAETIAVPSAVNAVIPYESFTVSSEVPQRVGYSFMGWKVTASDDSNTALGTKIVQAGETFTMPAELNGIKFTAQWVASTGAQNFNVSFTVTDTFNNTSAQVIAVTLPMASDGGSLTLNRYNFPIYVPGYRPADNNFTVTFTTSGGVISPSTCSCNVYGITIIDSVEYTNVLTEYGLTASVRQNMAGKYLLTNDIALSGEITPIGYTGVNSFTKFSGVFDGGNHSITNFTSTFNAGNIGLFSYNKGTIRNLNLSGTTVSGKYLVGAIAGANQGTINNCSVSMTLLQSTYYINYDVMANTRFYGCYTGGITGLSSGTIINCSFNGEVKNTLTTVVYVDSVTQDGYPTQIATPASQFIGGITGINIGTIEKSWFYGGINSDSYTSGNINANLIGIGGIAGTNFSVGATITNCWSDAILAGAKYVGGIAGTNKSYATIASCWASYRGIRNSSGNSSYSGVVLGNNAKDTNSSFSNCYYEYTSVFGLGTQVSSLKTGTVLAGLSESVWSFTVNNRPQIIGNESVLANQ